MQSTTLIHNTSNLSHISDFYGRQEQYKYREIYKETEVWWSLAVLRNHCHDRETTCLEGPKFQCHLTCHQRLSALQDHIYAYRVLFQGRFYSRVLLYNVFLTEMSNTHMLHVHILHLVCSCTGWEFPGPPAELTDRPCWWFPSAGLTPLWLLSSRLPDINNQENVTCGKTSCHRWELNVNIFLHDYQTYSMLHTSPPPPSHPLCATRGTSSAKFCRH